jgi:DUF438 domain-containing protein
MTRSRSSSKSNARKLAQKTVHDGINTALQKTVNRLTRKNKEQLEKQFHDERLAISTNITRKAYEFKPVVAKILEKQKFLTDLEKELNGPFSNSFTSPSKSTHSKSARSKSASQTRKGGKKTKKRRPTK